MMELVKKMKKQYERSQKTMMIIQCLHQMMSRAVQDLRAMKNPRAMMMSRASSAESENNKEFESDDALNISIIESTNDDATSSPDDSSTSSTAEENSSQNGFPEEDRLIDVLGDSSADEDGTSLGAEADSSPDDTAPELLGCSHSRRRENPKYFNPIYTHLQFLQHSFETLTMTEQSDYLHHAFTDYALTGWTSLVEQYLTGVVLTQMSGNAGLLKKHGKESEKCLLKELTQFKDMDVMDALDPDKLTAEQIKGICILLNMCQIIGVSDFIAKNMI